jgi:hypothetical protein
MDKNPDRKRQDDSEYWNDMIGQNGVFSTTECTGMIARPPLSEEEVNGYLDLFHMPQQKAAEAVKAENPAEQKLRAEDVTQ